MCGDVERQESERDIRTQRRDLTIGIRSFSSSPFHFLSRRLLFAASFPSDGLPSLSLSRSVHMQTVKGGLTDVYPETEKERELDVGREEEMHAESFLSVAGLV